MRLGIVTCAKCSELTASEKPLLGLLRADGHDAEPVVWNNKAIDWSRFDGLMIRSIWDYHLYPLEFLQWLSVISDIPQLQANTWNPVSVLRWNAHKFYLRDLSAKGVTVAPTLFMRQGDTTAAEQARKMGWEKIVVKPAVSASGYRTHAFSLISGEASLQLSDAGSHGDYLVQPFLEAIEEAGEVSLIYFQNRFSHAVLKKPKKGDFRVQNEYGGQALPFQPEDAIIHAGEEILRHTDMPILYARVDGLIERGKLVLMELELIEPDLYLEVRSGADRELVNCFLNCLRPSASS